MAGIGFQLRAVLGRGELSGTVGAVASGLFVVAGPWLASAASMSVLQLSLARQGLEGGQAFFAAVIYCFAVSLCLYAGLHYIFTRLVADLSWDGRYGEATSWMLRLAAFAALSAMILGLAGLSLLPVDEAIVGKGFAASSALLFGGVSAAWILLLYSSLLRNHRLVTAAFAAGMAAGVLAASALARTRGPSGAVLGYAAGLWLADALLAILGTVTFPPRKPRSSLRDAVAFARTHAALGASGFLFYLGQWIDTFAFWASRGEPVAGLGLRLYAAYDGYVFMAGLSIIPGLVYFVVASETRVYTYLRRFLRALDAMSLSRIRESRASLAGCVRDELRRLGGFQAAFSLAAGAALAWLRPDSLGSPVPWLALGAAYFLCVLLSLLVFLYYLELYREALASALALCALNGLGALLPSALGAYPPAGLGRLLAAIVACGLAYALLRRSIGRLERAIYVRSLRAGAPAEHRKKRPRRPEAPRS